MAAFLRIRGRKTYKERREPSESDYKKLYRFRKENVEWLSQYFLGNKDERRGAALTSEQQMRIFLRYVADPGFQNGIGEEIGVHQSTVSRTITCVTEKIKEKTDEWIKFPSTIEDMRAAKAKWQQRYNFPTAIGALDCTHVKIPKPTAHGDEYVNRKGFPSINIQATCDSKEYFTSVDVSWPGSVHDSRVWRNSTVHAVMQRSRNAVLLADGGYQNAPWLMVPYRNPDTPQQISYNRLLSSERVIIERCFGQLKRRFPSLHYGVRLALPSVPSFILTCFILHNISKYLQDDDDFDDVNENCESDSDTDGDYNDHEPAIHIRGQHKRNELAEIIHNL